MSELFILQNQDNLFFSKQKDWVDGRDLNSLFKSTYKDEAINQMVEISAKDYRQRIKVIKCGINDKGLPVIDPDIMPDPQPKAGKDLFAELDATATEPDSVLQTELDTETDNTEFSALADVDAGVVDDFDTKMESDLEDNLIASHQR